MSTDFNPNDPTPTDAQLDNMEYIQHLNDEYAKAQELVDSE